MHKTLDSAFAYLLKHFAWHQIKRHRIAGKPQYTCLLQSPTNTSCFYKGESQDLLEAINNAIDVNDRKEAE